MFLKDSFRSLFFGGEVDGPRTSAAKSRIDPCRVYETGIRGIMTAFHIIQMFFLSDSFRVDMLVPVGRASG